ncbi:MAG: ubiquinol-cytochrome c reductase cytochrome c subunit [Pseudonocardiales bacterium]|nr:ubiquinol-cytochrome c reductase cytochrome c subunit [Pseudonocardiales bacterium]
MTEDFDVDGELGFEPAVPVTGAEPRTGAPRTWRRLGTSRYSLRRRIVSSAILIAALGSMGGAYAAFASNSGASGTSANNQIDAGKQLYETSCITCHGANLQGVKDRGVPLLGVGGAAVYFQVSTGRMPLAGQAAESIRKTSKFTEQETNDLAAYIQSLGGGPTIPDGSLRDGNIADGGELFRLNCASCHGTTGRGAPLSAGKQIPSLMDANDKQMYSAMLTGPENMPIFSDNQLTPQQKREVVAYIQTLKASADPGGQGIGRIGPVSESIVIWVGGIGVLMIVILWIGAKNE